MKTALIIEDDVVISSALSSAFERKGWAVRTMQSAETLEAQLLEAVPSVLLLDIRLMSSMTGIDAAKMVSEKFPSLVPATVVMTASMSSEYVAQVMEYGITHYIIKSDTDPEHIVEKCEKMTAGATG
jgi:DNA-binding NarL/FixJ family response regulator